jgi:pseudouridine synthase
VERTYTALVSGVPPTAALRSLERGVELDDGLARAVRARRLAVHGDSAMIEITMIEGRKREVRRMMDAIGHRVERLIRTGIGPIRDRRLQPGTFRALTVDEVRALYRAAAPDDG